MNGNPALVIIDMQNDFVRPGAPVAVGGAMEIIPALQEVLAAFRRTGTPVVFVRRGHRADGSDIDCVRQEYFDRTGGFLIDGTEGAEIIAELRPLPGEPVVVKTRFSAFFMTEFLALLIRRGITSLVLGGVNTANCLRSTAFDGISYDFDVTILSDGSAAGTPEIQRANLDDMRRVGIDIASCAEVADGLAAESGLSDRSAVVL
jgi:nicotinamidase-related amidase